MAIDLGALREDIKPKQGQELLSKDNLEKDKLQAELVKLVSEVKRKNHSRVGRPKKNKEESLTARLTILLTEEQKMILEKRRGADELGEIDSSTFIREWLKRTGFFDRKTYPITKQASMNLPPVQP
tara:strand:+ start:237 stop:614 length:378 start_codon:yes stop_codon:yes gene_type:complete